MAAIIYNFRAPAITGTRTTPKKMNTLMPNSGVDEYQKIYKDNEVAIPRYIPNVWWEDFPEIIKTLYVSASQIPWFQYYNKYKDCYCPIPFERMTSFSIYKTPLTDEITLTFKYYSGIRSLSESEATRNDRVFSQNIIIRLAPDYTTTTHYKITTRTIPMDRSNTKSVTNEIRRFMQKMKPLAKQLSDIEFPPTSYNIMCSVIQSSRGYVGYDPSWQCVSTYNSPGCDDGSKIYSSNAHIIGPSVYVP